VLPASYNLLKPKQRSQIVQMSLLSLSRKVDYVISVMGWLGASSAGKGGDPINRSEVDQSEDRSMRLRHG
jgi:type IV secretory pathway VirJ component